MLDDSSTIDGGKETHPRKRPETSVSVDTGGHIARAVFITKGTYLAEAIPCEVLLVRGRHRALVLTCPASAPRAAPHTRSRV